MASDHECPNEILKDSLLNLDEPVIFKNILSNTGPNGWKLLDWSLDDLAEKLENQKLPFRVGKNAKTVHPQWEVDAQIENKTLTEFLNEVKKNDNLLKSFYFDYKYMREWFTEKSDVLESFNWLQFGFELYGSDSTIWIGSKGAHTNCHQDTYGCNLVAQIHGRKLWMLFSPECTNLMQPTRIPYEESTIFSKYNFFTPGKKEIQALKNMTGNVKIIILEPKDVLFIPRGWWHYVESLETSLSVNVWIPVKEDCDSRLNETLVNLIVNTIGEGTSKTINQPESNLLESIQFIEASLNECQKFEDVESLKKQKISNMSKTASSEYLKTKYQNHFELVPNLTSENMSLFLEKNNIDKTDNTNNEENVNKNDQLSKLDILETVVNAFCHPDITLRVSQILKDEFVKKRVDIS